MNKIDTQTRQQEFRKELGLRNLVMCQILVVVGLNWVGVAAKLGPSHVVFWLLAIVLFYLPSAAVVIYLNRIHAVEGGLYEWTRLGFNEFTGFLTGWNVWLNCVVTISYAGIQAATTLSYALGAEAAWIAQSKWFMAVVTLLVLAVLAAIAWTGLRVGKWVQDAGGMILLIVFLALIALPFRGHAIGRPAQYPPFTLAFPAISLLSLNLLGKMCFGAMSGFDATAILAGESRNAAKTIGWSVMIAAPVIAAMFVMGTSSVVAMVPQDKIDLVNPISQALTLGTRPGDPGAGLIPLVMFVLLFSFLSSQALNLAFAARLPLVAGWDSLLPEWFGKLHPTHKTPTNSILVVTAVASALGIVAIAGSGQQEAYQLLQNASLIVYALAYLTMFALPLAGKQRAISPPPLWLTAASVTGFLMTALYVVLSLFPIIDVANPLLFTAKLSAFTLVCQFIAVALFYSYRRRRSPARMAAVG